MLVSPETFIELIVGMHDGDGSHFQSDQTKVRVMAGTDRPVFLPFCGEFSLEKTLGIVRPARFTSSNFTKWYDLVTSATSRTQFFTVWNQELFVEQHRVGKDSYREWLKDCATGEYADFTPPERWAENHAKQLGYDITPEQATRLSDGLSATYYFRKADFAKANKNATFKWDRPEREADWVDGQQLLYLCDPSIHMLTDESGIKRKCFPSPQSDRVLILSEFVRDLGVHVAT
jgi:hypothetical protein